MEVNTHTQTRSRSEVHSHTHRHMFHDPLSVKSLALLLPLRRTVPECNQGKLMESLLAGSPFPCRSPVISTRCRHPGPGSVRLCVCVCSGQRSPVCYRLCCSTVCRIPVYEQLFLLIPLSSCSLHLLSSIWIQVLAAPPSHSFSRSVPLPDLSLSL